jgi:predicted PurR-regulated permease PerM
MSEIANRRLGLAIIVAAAIIILIWGIRGLAGILNPILLAAVITITLLPVPKALEKRGLKSGPALLVTILLVVLFIVGFTWLLLASISQMNVEIATYSAGFQAQNDSVEADATVVDQIGQSVMRTLNQQQYSQLFSTLVTVFGSAVSQLFLTLLIFIFMLYTTLSMPNLSRIGIDARAGALDQMIGLTGNVRRYMALTAFINLLVGIGDALLLWFFDVPYAILWGAIAWVLGFIPAVGYWIALIPPVLLAYSLYGTRTALIIFIMYAVINGTAANIISPRVLGKGLSISPLIVFVSVFIWGWLLGAIGAILAIPLTMLIITILDNFAATQWLARLMSYVPGSEKEADVAAVDHARGLLAGIRRHIPSLIKEGPPAPIMADAAPEMEPGGGDQETDGL